jgi:hypothetical protein
MATLYAEKVPQQLCARRGCIRQCEASATTYAENGQRTHGLLLAITGITEAVTKVWRICEATRMVTRVTVSES